MTGPHPDNAKYVYFLRRKDGVGPVKIGCTQMVAKRFYSIQLWSPYPLEVLATVRGGHDLERNLHSCFADHHYHNEWFHPAPELLVAIQKLAAGVPVAEAVDLTAIKGSIRRRKVAA